MNLKLDLLSDLEDLILPNADMHLYINSAHAHEQTHCMNIMHTPATDLIYITHLAYAVMYKSPKVIAIACVISRPISGG